MNLSQDKQKIWCHYCFQWRDKETEILTIGEDVYCLICYDYWKGLKAHLGYSRELYPCKYYYEYHKKGQCRCVQAETNCNNDESICDNQLGKRAYEQDLEEFEIEEQEREFKHDERRDFIREREEENDSE